MVNIGLPGSFRVFKLDNVSGQVRVSIVGCLPRELYSPASLVKNLLTKEIKG